MLIYYLSGAYLLDPAVSTIGRGAATALGIAPLVAGWAVYDGLWRSPLADRPGVATAVSLVLLAAATIALCRLLSGRAAYMHLGVEQPLPGDLREPPPPSTGSCCCCSSSPGRRCAMR